MAIIKAYTLPHPPLAIPGIGRGQEEGIKDTLKAFDEVAREITGLAPETIIYITPHSVMYSDYFHISPGKTAQGDFGGFGVPSVKLETNYDEEFVNALAGNAKKINLPAGTLGEREAKLDHGVTVPMWFINRCYKSYKSVRISQSGLSQSDHYRLGQLISETAGSLGRKTVLIASSDLSHKLKHDGPYGFAPEGPQFDSIISQVIADGAFLSLLKIPEKIRERAAECGYNSLVVLAGCFDKRRVEPRLFSYEGPYGVGYAIGSFAPAERDGSISVLEQFEEFVLQEARLKKEAEDVYRALARRSLEYKIKVGRDIELPDSLPEELIGKKAGVFVSLYKNGQLRGCIGTISPATGSVAKEIIQNAVSAGLRDSRFDLVTESELPYLTYKVDILAAPEPVSEPGELDVKRYGVIVTCGHKRGLLLPNLDGIDTVEEQIAIAKRKAGIAENEPIKLERFEVTRYE